MFPTSKWLAAVPSVSGGSGSTSSGYGFQGGAHLFKNGSVIWAPQAWKMNDTIWFSPSQPNIGTANYVFFFVKIQIDTTNNKIIYRAYSYSDSYHVEHDAPSIYTFYQTPIPTGNSNFLVGYEYYGGIWFKFFQTGIESNLAITETNWSEMNGRIAYFNASNMWHFDPGKSIWGNYSWITHNSTHGVPVGGQNYNGVNKVSSSNNFVYWKRTGTTLGNGTTLWTNSGTPVQVVTLPYS